MRTLRTTLAACLLALPLTTAWGDAPVKKPAVREIDLKEFRGKPTGQVQKPVVISNINELANSLGLCLKQQLPYQLAKDVDFEKERLLFIAWSGSDQDQLSFTTERCPKAPSFVTGVSFQYQRGVSADVRPHYRLFVVPKNVPWQLSEVSKTK